jgi:hypothetical protein
VAFANPRPPTGEAGVRRSIPGRVAGEAQAAGAVETTFLTANACAAIAWACCWA